MSNPSGARKVTYRVPADAPDAARKRPRSPNDDEDVERDDGEAEPRSRGSRRGSSSSSSSSSSEDGGAPLLAVCEPLFDQICHYSHAIQNGVVLSYPQVRREVEDLLETIRESAHAKPATAGLFEERVEQALIFFVDNFFAECGQLPIAADWGQNRLAFGLNPPNYVGDQQFFKHLDQLLKEKTEGVKQKLAVFFTCIGLGMTGIYASDPAKLRYKQSEIAQRIRGMLESSAKKRLCPDAYENINTESLIEPPIKPPVLIAIALAGMLLVLLVVYFVAYRASTQDLERNLDQIHQRIQSTSK